ncbi:hypothetical protein NMY22_g10543 [Coprinellus aureogranulatus]|nr:hypothetical protein NMY22_g10543 [Coprinellus aureogranulatus]
MRKGSRSTSKLEDGWTLSGYNIWKESHLVLVLRGGMQISVKTLTGKTVILNVEPPDTIDNVKAKTQDKRVLLLTSSVSSSPANNLRIVAPCPTITSRIFVKTSTGKTITMSHYNIQKESSLHLVLRILGGMQMFVKKFTGMTVTLEFESSSTIDNVAEIQDKEGVPRPATTDLRRQTTGGRANVVRLQHSEGVYPPLGSPSTWRQLRGAFLR